MFSNTYLKINTKKSEDRFIQTDNHCTYFIISDFNNPDDGLWSSGFHIFDSIIPEEPQNVIESKIFFPTGTQVTFAKKYILNYLLFKNDNGFLIEINNKNIIYKTSKEYKINFNINSKFEIIEKNIKNIILEYPKAKKEERGLKKMLCAISVRAEYDIKNIEKNENGITFITQPIEKGIKEPDFYVLYNSDYNELKKQLEINIERLEILKKEHFKDSISSLRYLDFQTDDKLMNKALAWAFISSASFVMQKNKNIGIWAGFPWFTNNWGRDTFISIPGISLVSGRYEEAWNIIDTFSKFQCKQKTSPDYGKIPNVILTPNKILYNSADVTPLFIREIYEYFLYSGDYKSIISIWENINLAVQSNDLSKKDENNFITHKDAEDWMDAKKNDMYSFSPRGDKAVEIQALWYTALYSAANMALAIMENAKKNSNNKNSINIDELIKISSQYKEEAKKLKQSFKKYFFSDSPPFIYDHLTKDYKPNQQIRPNSLLSLYYSTLPGIPPLINKNIGIRLLKFLMPDLIYKHGVASLSKKDPFFHPLHIHKMYNKDASYHNGSIWLWLSGIFINIACKYGLHDIAFQHTQNLSNQILEIDTLGALSELVNPYLESGKKAVASGAYSQAWSISEFCRSFYQDYLGITFNVPKRKIYISPSIPVKLNSIKTNIRFGLHEALSIYVRLSKKTSNVSLFEIKGIEIQKPIFVIIKICLGYEIINEKYKKRFIIIKCKFNKINDIFRVSFESIKLNLIKLKEINNIENCELLSLKSKSVGFKEQIEDGIQFADPISENELAFFQTIKKK